MSVEELEKLKPNSIFDVVDEKFFIERNSTHRKDVYLGSGRIYEYYYAIGKYYKPKSILETGSRYGYSLFSLAKGSGKVEYLKAYDINEYNDDSIEVCQNNLNIFCPEIPEIYIENKNTRSIIKLDRFYDLIHVDGEHTHDGKINDLNLTLGKCKVLVIDDVGGGLPIVQQAANTWISHNFDQIKNLYFIDSKIEGRGQYVIEYKDQQEM